MKIFLILILLLSPFSLYADPQPWQMGFQTPATETMEKIVSFHNFLMYILLAIVILVVGLLAYVLIKFNKKSNPIPKKFTHNNALEIIWTLIPLGIVAFFAFPSIDIVKLQESSPESPVIIKVTGYQWYWGYEYSDHGISFDSNMKSDDQLLEGELRLLEVDNRMVVPVNTNIKIQTTSADVVHSWAVPAFGIKKDAVPGRLNETWFNVKEVGVYRGQCSELCGMHHGFMPIVVEVVTQSDFDSWVKKKQNEQ